MSVSLCVSSSWGWGGGEGGVTNGPRRTPSNLLIEPTDQNKRASTMPLIFV